MAIIYEPRGKAGEYAPLAVNLYSGCAHGCVYCYVPPVLRIDRDRFSGDVRPKADVLARLAREARTMAGDPREILLSFTSDPYQPCERELGLTREALSLMSANRLKPTVLTKGGELARRDFDILAATPGALFAATLTTDDAGESLEWEPGAAPPDERVENLRLAHEAGIGTWVSFEPVFNPAAVYRLLERTAPFVDLFKIGKLNYHPAAGSIEWPAFRENCLSILDRLGKPHLIKKDLLAAR